MAFDAAFDIGLQPTDFSSGTFTSLAVGGVFSGAWDIGDHTPVEFATGTFTSLAVGGVFSACFQISQQPTEFTSRDFVGLGIPGTFNDECRVVTVAMRAIFPGDEAREIVLGMGEDLPTFSPVVSAGVCASPLTIMSAAMVVQIAQPEIGYNAIGLFSFRSSFGRDEISWLA